MGVRITPRRVVGGLVVLMTVSSFVDWGYNWGDKHFLDLKDFRQARWVQVDNSDGRLRDNLEAQKNISCNIKNLIMYEDEIARKNQGKISGDILVPMLDELPKYREG
jgi:hypothetical protein